MTAYATDLMCYLKIEHLLTLSPFISRDLIITYPTDSMCTHAHTRIYIMKTNISEAFSTQTGAPEETKTHRDLSDSHSARTTNEPCSRGVQACCLSADSDSYHAAL